MAGSVQLHVDGRPFGTPVVLLDGDSVQFTMPGKLLEGSVAIATERIAGLEEELRGARAHAAELEELVRKMALAESVEAVAGIAYRAGQLRDADF